jgi:hypothetical protein
MNKILQILLAVIVALHQIAEGTSKVKLNGQVN